MADPLELDFSESGLVTTEQAAEILGTSVTYVRRLRYLGKIVPFKLAGTNRNTMVFYRKTDIEAYRDRHPGLGSYSKR